MTRPAQQDVVLIGAGLSGLAAGIALQAGGLRTRIVERRGVAGGLCGTFELAGYEFALGCNDFGAGAAHVCAELGVAAGLRPCRTRFHWSDGPRVAIYSMPPDLRSVARLARFAPALLRLAAALRRAEQGTLADRIDASLRGSRAGDLVASLGYPLGSPPERIPSELVRAELSRELRYGYDRPHAPVGGPAAFVQAFVDRYVALGGHLELGVEAGAVARSSAGFQVSTSAGSFSARAVVSSEGRWAAYPQDSEPSLAVAMLHLVVHRDLPYPKGVHTLVWLPANVAGWLRALDRGELPESPGFHLFRSDLPARPDHYTLNAYCLAPRGLPADDVYFATRAQQTMLAGAEQMVPGLGAALIDRFFVDTDEFRTRHGLSSVPWARVVTRPGFMKPDCRDPQTGIFHVGTSVGPPGEHAGAALRSGMATASRVIEALSDERARK